MFLAMMEQFCHAFCPSSWHYTPEGDLFAHVVVEVAAFAGAGAALLASGPFRDSLPAAVEALAQLAAVLSLFVLVCSLEAGGGSRQ